MALLIVTIRHGPVGEVIYQNHYLDATTYAEEVAYVRNFAAACNQS